MADNSIIEQAKERVNMIRTKIFGGTSAPSEETVLERIKSTTEKVTTTARERMKQIPILSESPILSRIAGEEKTSGATGVIPTGYTAPEIAPEKVEVKKPAPKIYH